MLLLRNAPQNLGARLELDRTHPLVVSGLVWLGVNMFGAGPVIDLVGQRQATATIGTWGVGRRGLLVRDWAASNAGTPDMAFTSGPFTVASFFRLSAVPGNGQYPIPFARYAYVNESNNQGWSIDVSASNDAAVNKYRFLSFRNNGNVNYALVTATTATAGEHLVVGTSDGSALRTIYLDGASEATSVNNASPVSTSGNLVNASLTAQVPTYLTWAWSRTLTASEVAWLFAEPLGMIREQRVTRAFFMQPPQIPLDPAVLAWTGQDLLFGGPAQRRSLGGSRSGSRQPMGMN